MELQNSRGALGDKAPAPAALFAPVDVKEGSRHPVSCCCMAIAAATRLLVGVSLLVVPRKSAPLLSGGVSDSEEIYNEPNSSEDEVSFTGCAWGAARPITENAALLRCKAVLHRQGGVFVASPGGRGVAAGTASLYA